MWFENLKPLGVSVQRWVRGELPSRALPLEFDIADPADSSTRDPLSLLAFYRACQNAKTRREALLQCVARQIEDLNRRSVTLATRWVHISIAERFATPHIGAIYAEYAVREENPESEQRKALTQAAINAVQQFAAAYELMLQACRRLSDRSYALCHRQVLRAGHRVLELLHAEQQLCALRRVKLSERAWRNANQLYFALSECEDLHAQQSLAGFLVGPKRAAWQPKAADEAPTHASLQQIYIAIQVCGMMEPASWAPRQYSWLLVYLRRTLVRLKIRPYKHVALDDEHLMITATQQRSPTFKMRDKPKEPAVLLNVGALQRRVQRDVDRLNAGHKDTLFTRLVNTGGVSLLEQAQLLEHMLKKLCFHEKRDARKAVNEYVDLDLRWGFTDVIAVIKATNMSGTYSEHADGQKPSDASHEKGWLLINDSPGGMQLRFQEARVTKPLFIGQLMVWTSGGDETREAPGLSYINRMQRIRNGEIEVALQKIADESEYVDVLDARMMASGAGLPGMLVHCLDGKWRLLLHSKHASYAMSKLYARSEGELQLLTVGRMHLYQPEFVLFDIAGFDR